MKVLPSARLGFSGFGKQRMKNSFEFVYFLLCPTSPIEFVSERVELNHTKNSNKVTSKFEDVVARNKFDF